jgi:hypothetical protein
VDIVGLIDEISEKKVYSHTNNNQNANNAG